MSTPVYRKPPISATPWRVGDAGLTVFGPPNGTPTPETIASCRTRANARLIAAAPRLLEVFEKLFAAAHCGYDPLVVLREFGEEAREVYREATGFEWGEEVIA